MKKILIILASFLGAGIIVVSVMYFNNTNKEPELVKDANIPAVNVSVASYDEATPDNAQLNATNDEATTTETSVLSANADGEATSESTKPTEETTNKNNDDKNEEQNKENKKTKKSKKGKGSGSSKKSKKAKKSKSKSKKKSKKKTKKSSTTKSNSQSYRSYVTPRRSYTPTPKRPQTQNNNKNYDDSLHFGGDW